MKATLLELELKRRRVERKAIHDKRRSEVSHYGQTAPHLRGCFIARKELNGRRLCDLDENEFMSLLHASRPKWAGAY